MREVSKEVASKSLTVGIGLTKKEPIPFSLRLTRDIYRWVGVQYLISAPSNIPYILDYPSHTKHMLSWRNLVSNLTPYGPLANALSRSKSRRSVCIKCPFCGTSIFEWPLKPFFALICVGRNNPTTDFCILILFSSFAKALNYWNIQKEEYQYRQNIDGLYLFILWQYQQNQLNIRNN